ncbi:MAG: polysaccharide lyase 6 family protein [Armatimonadia bacterium]
MKVARRAVRVLIVGLVASLGSLAMAATVRVSTQAELDAAIHAAGPGDTIVMSAGDWKDTAILLEAEGEPDRPITLRAETPGKTVLCGRSKLRIAGGYLQVEGLMFTRGGLPGEDPIAFRKDPSKLSHHCRLTECAVVDYDAPGSDKDCKWVSVYGTHNRVDHCYFAGKTSGGTLLVIWVGPEPNEHRIDHNHFGPRPPLGRNGGETIRVGTSDVSMSVSRTVVEGNLFERCNGETEIISSKSCENVYRYNTFVECEGALTLRHGNRCLVEGNWFLGKGKKNTGGVRVIGEDHRVVNNYFCGLTGRSGRSAVSLMNGLPNSELSGYFQVKRAVVAFNSIIDCDTPITLGLKTGSDPAKDLPPMDCTIANNLIRGTRAPLVTVQTAPTGTVWHGNLVSGGDTGLGDEPGLQSVDLRLREAPDGLWRPAPDSPVCSAAIGGFPFVTEDIDGQPRGTTYDVGCDQLATGPVTRHPLTPAQVGPSWRPQ